MAKVANKIRKLKNPDPNKNETLLDNLPLPYPLQIKENNALRT